MKIPSTLSKILLISSLVITGFTLTATKADASSRYHHKTTSYTNYPTNNGYYNNDSYFISTPNAYTSTSALSWIPATGTGLMFNPYTQSNSNYYSSYNSGYQTQPEYYYQNTATTTPCNEASNTPTYNVYDPYVTTPITTNYNTGYTQTYPTTYTGENYNTNTTSISYGTTTSNTGTYTTTSSDGSTF